ncbi:MAG: LysR family transcriptional regulator [Myxococcales bacterium]|nr:LysR family transcriptional regulator [Myxococcales bacterium]
MARFSDVDVFLAVVEAGSFRGAVASLGVTRSTVSRAIQRLEDHLAASLFLRDTHSVRLTDAGAAYHQHASRAQVALAEAERAVASTTGEVEGLLRISGTPALGPAMLAPACASFLGLHPKVSIELSLTDRLVNPLQEDVDLAVRTGSRLSDSELTSRRLTSASLIAVATPELAAVLDVRAQVPFVEFLPLGLSRYGEPSVPLHVRLRVDDYLSVVQAVLQGAGVGVTSELLVAEHLQTGRLVRVLPDWALPEARFWAVYPKARVQPVKLRAFVDHLATSVARAR